MNLRIDRNEFAPIIEQAVDAAIARVLGERVENADGPILLSKAGAAEAMDASASTIDSWRREEGLPFVDGLRSRNWLPAGGEVTSR